MTMTAVRKYHSSSTTDNDHSVADNDSNLVTERLITEDSIQWQWQQLGNISSSTWQWSIGSWQWQAICYWTANHWRLYTMTMTTVRKYKFQYLTMINCHLTVTVICNWTANHSKFWQWQVPDNDSNAVNPESLDLFLTMTVVSPVPDNDRSELTVTATCYWTSEILVQWQWQQLVNGSSSTWQWSSWQWQQLVGQTVTVTMNLWHWRFYNDNDNS